MARILMLDNGDFDLSTLHDEPLGGAETAFGALAEAFAAMGHSVAVRNNCRTESQGGTLEWAPLACGVPPVADLAIVNRSPGLLPLVPRAARQILWLHNNARYLLRTRHLKRLARYRPTLVFSGSYHRSTLPRWVLAGPRETIPYGLLDIFRHAQVDDHPPPPRAIFTSNPLRELDWLMDIWSHHIHPRIPHSELHIYSGPQTYRGWGKKVTHLMEPILEKARQAVANGIHLHAPLPRPALIENLCRSRVMLYRGMSGETFCLALAEAQAVGVPCVVQDRGSVAERIFDQVTGFVTASDEEFAQRATELLEDNDLWSHQHRAAIDLQRRRGWQQAADDFLSLLYETP